MKITTFKNTSIINTAYYENMYSSKNNILQIANPFLNPTDLKPEDKSSRKFQKLLIHNYENYYY